jgi:hypothetical protein
VILLRTHKLSGEIKRFGERLAAESGIRLVYLMDENQQSFDVSPFEKTKFTSGLIRELGLHTPHGYAWRCGDYGLYLAAKQFPDVRYFWLIEYDVRIHTKESMRGFFDRYAALNADLIAPKLERKGQDWWWFPTMRSGNKPVYGCLFSCIRVSAPLIAAALEERKRISRSPIYKLFWPNDESLIATVAARRGFKSIDLNDSGVLTYTDQSFSFESPISGDVLEAEAADGLIYHPVLYGAEYEAKSRRLARPTTLKERSQRKLRNLLSSFA